MTYNLEHATGAESATAADYQFTDQLNLFLRDIASRAKELTIPGGGESPRITVEDIVKILFQDRFVGKQACECTSREDRSNSNSSLALAYMHCIRTSCFGCSSQRL